MRRHILLGRQLGRQAASNGNLQPWLLYVIMGKARERLSAAILKAMDEGDAGPDAEYDVYPKQFTPLYDSSP